MPEPLGRYELARKIATGGMGDVYFAHQWGDGGFVRPSVVKRLHPHLAERGTALDDFRNEAKLLAQLTHPGIPHVYDFRFLEGRWFIAMEFVRGPTLAEVRRAEASIGRTMPWKAALSVVLQLCDVLAYVHDRRDDDSDEPLGIIHGDLSPANVILGRDGQVRLLDFGIAGSVEHRRQQREREKGIRGTLGYLAPEQIRHERTPDRRADVFVLGVLLYEMTTGQRLFPGDGLNFMNAVLERSPRPPTEWREDYPRELERIVLHALQREPEHRPASTRELQHALETFAKANQVPVGERVIIDYAETLFPAREDARVTPGEKPGGMETESMPAVPMPMSDAPPEGTLTAEEREEVLRDLQDLFPSEERALDDEEPAFASEPPEPLSLPPEALQSAPPSVQPPPPPIPPTPPTPEPEPPSQTQTRARRPPGESETEGARDAGVYIYVAEDD